MGSRRKPRRSPANARLFAAADAPMCKRCGSPWFEPQYGALFCCDCGAQFGTEPNDAA